MIREKKSCSLHSGGNRLIVLRLGASGTYSLTMVVSAGITMGKHCFISKYDTFAYINTIKVNIMVVVYLFSFLFYKVFIFPNLFTLKRPLLVGIDVNNLVFYISGFSFFSFQCCPPLLPYPWDLISFSVAS